MQADEREQILHGLANALARRRLQAPARIVLDTVAPLGMLASQAMLFMRPLLPNSRWRSYASALGDEQGWSVLQRFLEP
jgi:hypothetical protein